MSNQSDAAGEDAMRDIDAFHQALSGREGTAAAASELGEDSHTAEGRMLRAQIARRQISVEPVADIDVAREAELLVKARDEGLIGSAPKDVISRRRSSRIMSWGLAVAAGIAAVTLTLRFVSEPVGEPKSEVVRAGNDVVLIANDNPARAQRKLAEVLWDSDVDAKTYERFGHFGIDADLPPTIPQAVRTELAQLGLTVAPDGELKVEFVAR